MTVCTYAKIALVDILMHIRAEFPFSRSNMSSVRQDPIYFVPVFLFLFILAPATEGMVVFILKFRDHISHINRKLKFILCLVKGMKTRRQLGERRTD